MTCPTHAMILAAGEGQRMRPITLRRPKPLVEIQGEPLIDRALDRLAAAGVETAVVNLHHLGAQLREHLAARPRPQVLFSEEETLLETGGGIAKALPLLGDAPFYVVNGDALWLDGATPALERLARHWDDAQMDVLLLLHPMVAAHGFEGRGDFVMDATGRLDWPPENRPAPFAYAGVHIASPRLFEGVAVERFRLPRLWETARLAGRLHGIRHDGEWFHVGTPEAILQTERLLLDLGVRPRSG